MVPTKRRKPPSLLRIILLSVIGSILVSGTIGYLIGTSRLVYSFTPGQIEFIDGVVAGSHYREDYEEWSKEKPLQSTDIRGKPGVRCAADFFPKSPLGMDGCLAALDGRPPDGYQLPKPVR
jgi:hypothetical protein